MSKELKTRDQVEEKYTWRLSDIYGTKEAWEADLLDAAALGKEIEKFHGQVASSAGNLLKVMDLNEAMSMKLYKSMEYAQRLFDEDTANNEHQAMKAKVESLWVKISSAISFVDPEIIAAGKETVDGYMSEDEKLAKYRVQLDELFRQQEHTLSEELETILAASAEMASTPSDAYGMLGNADMEFPVIKGDDGEDIRITHGNFVSLEMSPNRQVREDAFKGLYNEYKHYINTISALYNGQVKKQIFYANARKYNSTLEAAVDGNNVPPTVYQNLVETVNNNLDKMHRYVSLRKKCLGVDELHMYDVYTSMIPDADIKMSYEEGKALTLEALKPMGEDYLEIVKQAYDERWIDVYENKGKRSGAYSAGCYDVHPYMLLNYTDTLDDVFTLIHEMGHSMHTWYSCKNQTFFNSNYVIFVAEVASTCNEVLLIEYLLKNTDDPKKRAYLLNHYLEMFKGTVYRQTMFAEFEMRSNKLAEDGDAINAQSMCDLYLELNKKYFGPDMISDDEIKYEWARIPHFYYNFYVYQYATSLCAAVAIAHAILEEGAPAVERYKKFLSAGCTKAPIDVLKIAGVDLNSPKPIQDALDVFEGIIEELEKLV